MLNKRSIEKAIVEFHNAKVNEACNDVEKELINFYGKIQEMLEIYDPTSAGEIPNPDTDAAKKLAKRLQIIENQLQRYSILCTAQHQETIKTLADNIAKLKNHLNDAPQKDTAPILDTEEELEVPSLFDKELIKTLIIQDCKKCQEHLKKDREIVADIRNTLLAHDLHPEYLANLHKHIIPDLHNKAQSSNLPLTPQEISDALKENDVSIVTSMAMQQGNLKDIAPTENTRRSLETIHQGLMANAQLLCVITDLATEYAKPNSIGDHNKDSVQRDIAILYQIIRETILPQLQQDSASLGLCCLLTEDTELEQLSKYHSDLTKNFQNIGKVIDYMDNSKHTTIQQISNALQDAWQTILFELGLMKSFGIKERKIAELAPIAAQWQLAAKQLIITIEDHQHTLLDDNIINTKVTATPYYTLRKQVDDEKHKLREQAEASKEEPPKPNGGTDHTIPFKRQ